MELIYAGRPIQSAQAMRGLAALSVAIFHTQLILAKPEYGHLVAFGPIVQRGWLGVNFFFVLSGFIILFAHSRDIGDPSQVGHYLYRRALRVYPIYWIILTAFIASAGLGLGHTNFKWETLHFATAYSLFELTDQPTLPLRVAWTLIFEVKFYLIFALCLMSRRVGLTIIMAWTVFILARNAFQPLPDWGYVKPDWGMLSIWNIYFPIGMAACWTYRRLPAHYGPVLIVLGAILFVCNLNYVSDLDSTALHPSTMVYIGLSFGFMVAGAALSEQLISANTPGMLSVLGDASYSIYLVHSAVISAAAQIYFKLHKTYIAPDLVALIVFLLAVSMGLVVHLLIEKPILRVLHRPRRNTLPREAEAV